LLWERADLSERMQSVSRGSQDRDSKRHPKWILAVGDHRQLSINQSICELGVAAEAIGWAKTVLLAKEFGHHATCGRLHNRRRLIRNCHGFLHCF
jgi:hypothetical protein